MFNPEEHNPKRILIAGDWHRTSHAEFPKRVIDYAKSQGIGTILHVGDFGYKFGSDQAYYFEKPLHMALKESEINLFWIDGNHENHEYLRTLEPLPSGFCQTGSRGHIYYCPRGLRWEWSGRKFGALGGALSPNRSHLTEGKTLFAGLEETKEEDLDRLGTEPLDYLITHDVPRRVALKENYIIPSAMNPTRNLLQRAVDTTKPKRVFSGHWHRRLDFRIPRKDNLESFGHLLNKEWRHDNIVILDLEADEIIEPDPAWLATTLVGSL